MSDPSDPERADEDPGPAEGAPADQEAPPSDGESPTTDGESPPTADGESPPADADRNGAAGAAESDGGAPDPDDPDPEPIGLAEVRDAALEGVEELLDHELEGVVRVERTDGGWRALVEVVERSAVPDTQDIIGRYEVQLDEAGRLTGYGLQERFRRGDMKEEL